MTEELKVTKEAHFQSDIDTVWQHLTDADITPKYMYGCSLVSDWEVGSDLLWKIEDKVQVKGEILKIEHLKELVYTVFDPNMGLPDVPENYLKVSYLLEEYNGGTKLTITQGDFSTVDEAEKRYNDAAQGWDYALDGLGKILK